jgi:uncharacterized protein (DUF1786 family)
MSRVLAYPQFRKLRKVPLQAGNRLAVLVQNNLATLLFGYIRRKSIAPGGSKLAAAVGQDVGLRRQYMQRGYRFVTLFNKYVGTGALSPGTSTSTSTSTAAEPTRAFSLPLAGMGAVAREKTGA